MLAPHKVRKIRKSRLKTEISLVSKESEAAQAISRKKKLSRKVNKAIEK